MGKLTIAPLRVRKCCDDMEPFYYEVHKDDTITFVSTGDSLSDFENVRFCQWCGKRLETYAEDPSEIIKTFEDLKKQMEKDEKERYAKLSPADKAKHDLKVEMIKDDVKKDRKKKR